MSTQGGGKRCCTGCGRDIAGPDDHSTKYCRRCVQAGRTAIEDNRSGPLLDIPDEDPPPQRHDLYDRRKVHGFRRKR